MDLFVNCKQNIENTNPVLVPTQYEILQKEGLFLKNQTNQHRYYYRKGNRQALTQNTQQSLQNSSSSQSLYKEIDRIVKALKQQKLSQQALNQQQYKQPPKQTGIQVDQMVEMLQNENLLRIHQLKVHTPRKPFTPLTNTNYLPPLAQESQSNCAENEQKHVMTEQMRLQTRNRVYSRKTTETKIDYKKTMMQEDNRHKRTTSQIINNNNNNNNNNNINIQQRISETIKNSKKILKACNQVKEIEEILNEEELKELVESDQFKIEFYHLINQSQGNRIEMESQLRQFILTQAKKYKELKQIEDEHNKIKENFSQFLKSYITELKDKI